MKKIILIATMLGIAATLAACSTRQRINLFEGGDYIMTAPPALVDGVETRAVGIWLSKDAVTRLQESGEIAGKIK